VPWHESHDTSLANSATTCLPDHRLLHNTRWTMRRLPGGDKEWVSPSGRIRRVAPFRRLSPAFVEASSDVEANRDAATHDPAATAAGTTASLPIDPWNTPAPDDGVMPF